MHISSLEQRSIIHWRNNLRMLERLILEWLQAGSIWGFESSLGQSCVDWMWRFSFEVEEWAGLKWAWSPHLFTQETLMVCPKGWEVIRIVVLTIQSNSTFPCHGLVSIVQSPIVNVVTCEWKHCKVTSSGHKKRCCLRQLSPDTLTWAISECLHRRKRLPGSHWKRAAESLLFVSFVEHSADRKKHWRDYKPLIYRQAI